MNPNALLVLPQNDTPENRAKRQQVLVEQQAAYRFDYNTATLAGLPMAATPIPIDLSLLWAARGVEVALALGENIVNIVLPNVIDFDIEIPLKIGKSEAGTLKASEPPPSLLNQVEADIAGAATEFHHGLSALAADAARFRDDLKEARTVLAGLLAASQETVAAAKPVRLPARSGLAADMAGFVAGKVEATLEQRVLSLIVGLVEKIAEFLGKLFGVYGRPSDLDDYQRQFRTLPVPWPADVYQTDEIFAQMRVAGPNPLMIRAATEIDLQGLPLGDRAAGVEDALKRNALFIADYSALAALQPGTTPSRKYVFTPRAFFEVPASGKRSLRPVAIQTAPTSPVLFPGDGTPWEIAKIIVNMADGNYHELISHLGLTHLLTEPFVITTYRQLDPTHPLFVLLTPHFAGTLFINYAAQTRLIADGGGVEQLLTGTIESMRGFVASQVKAVRYNQTFLPLTLAARGVDDAEALPDYPYRDDALALWNAIYAWVTAYVEIYYPTAEDVIQDYQLQAWVQELASVKGGSIQDIGDGSTGEAPRIQTATYLAKLLTQVIFTASVQHATVNFPQRTIMAYTPTMPLAAYAPFPAGEAAPATQILDILPPLQMGLLQQTIGTALGGIYYTTLGQYGGQVAVRQVGEALQTFQQALQRIEVDINRKNALGERTPYTTLLPSVIPQSINI